MAFKKSREQDFLSDSVNGLLNTYIIFHMCVPFLICICTSGSKLFYMPLLHLLFTLIHFQLLAGARKRILSIQLWQKCVCEKRGTAVGVCEVSDE